MEPNLQILYLEDSPDDAGLTVRALKSVGMQFNMLVVETKEDFIKALHTFNPGIILSDHSLPGFNSTEAFKIMLEKKTGHAFYTFNRLGI